MMRYTTFPINMIFVLYQYHKYLVIVMMAVYFGKIELKQIMTINLSSLEEGSAVVMIIGIMIL